MNLGKDLKNVEKKALLFVSIIIALSFVVNGADRCYYNDEPFFNNKMEMLCVFENISNGYSCVTEVMKEGKIIQVNPQRKHIFGYGVIDKFESVGSDEGLVRVYFRKQNIYVGGEFEFRVRCNDGTNDFLYAVNVTPNYKDMYWVLYAGEKIKERAGYFMVLGMISLIGLLIIVLMWKRWKGK